MLPTLCFGFSMSTNVTFPEEFPLLEGLLNAAMWKRRAGLRTA